jgi:hypothetical protein
MQTQKTKLEFGNPEHIALAAKGLLCQCGHAKAVHSVSNYCTAWVEQEHECDCGNQHMAEFECECAEFQLKQNLKFDPITNLYS